jgi:hypothetical protein
MEVSEIKDIKFLDSPKTNRKILDRLGYRRARTNEGVGFIFDAELQQRLEARFTPTPQEPTQPTQPTLEKEIIEKDVKVVKLVKDSGGMGVDPEDLQIVRKAIREEEQRIGYAHNSLIQFRAKEASNGRIDAERVTKLIGILAKQGELQSFGADCWKLK